ncbi:MAG: hypothetical protein B7Y39_05195 [Bdellovibrio sp. 28-41-41]|nr:MAG: hypothetical protein B7Y39_05195 [Bdellovibrio sp. 28-41-41]
MNFENFLQFWSAYNRQIIEFVFVSTFVLILFTIYRQFFAKTESVGGGDVHATPVSIDTSEIEEKLKKILENQGAFKAMPADPGMSSKTSTTSTATPSAGVDTQELEKLRDEIKEKEKAIEDLKKSAAAAPSGVGAVAAPADTKKLDDKIKELEGRLQEYEIISEDIADLSFYKEENARLQKELGSRGSAPAQMEPAAPAPVAKVEAAPIVAPAPVVAPIEPPPVAAAAPAPAETPAPGSIDSVIDDDILKEFAAAVEGQKSAEKPKKVAAEAPASTPVESAAPPTGEPAQPVDPQKLTESKELMGEFENFIKKG